MMTIFEVSLALFFFFVGYLLNMFYVSVFYHRGLAHKALELSAPLRKFIYQTGFWITGIDAKAWVCMHRMHHSFSDTEKDPHTPHKCQNFWQMFRVQLQSYHQTIHGLIHQDEEYTRMVKDIDFEVHHFVRKKMSYMPYVIQTLIGVAIGLVFSSPMIAFFYFVGIVSHPVQGGLVNYFGHKLGYRNYEINDDSKNNIIVALLTMGEGYQNNHHYSPSSAKFGVKWYEVDFGYLLCLLAQSFRIVGKIRK